MPSTPSAETGSSTDAVDALRQAVELIERHTPAALMDDVREIRRRVNWLCAALDPTRTCKKCGAAFTFDAVRYARNRMPPPQSCPACRRLR